MTTKDNNKREEMIEHLVRRLEQHYTYHVNRNKIIPALNIDIPTDYIKIGDEGLVMLLCKQYPLKQDTTKTPFEIIYSAMSKTFNNNVAVIFYGDGEMFFRQSLSVRKTKPEWTKDSYYENKRENVIIFRPEEKALYALGKRKFQYYNPTSNNLFGIGELFTCSFEGITPNYVGSVTDNGYKIPVKDLERDHLWTNRKLVSGNLRLNNGMLIPLE
jgi:hypothetical protein